ncbi:DUF2087 domain-containing protein [Lactiplantibacillus garii]|uniref:DUF2087 domain-containing protein n=1 Tax=Lactiplantibacillus garii TaxID=2306423 RepID=A0A426D8A5_9LACO|nr:DUF2087 domain-containing protein [Lactiplantibacillus garii]RRK10854.1 DUF2087 domain-containing protein [Lactiplantibacillus garii]
MQLNHLTLTDLKRGWHPVPTGWQCNYCQAHWSTASPEQERNEHLTLVHGGNLSQLIHLDSRYNTLTNKQQDLLTAFATGIKDQALANQLQVAAATIRHQKFTFREKAKQARLYLAIYEAVFEQTAAQETPLIDVPDQPGPVDDRFIITEDEAAATLQHYFDFDQQPLRLKRWPKKQKVILTVLTRIIDEIPANHHFSETELNQRLKPIYFDYPTVRRYLVDYGFLNRTTDGREYWRNTNGKD